MRIYVIRHGETLLNYKGVLQGWLDVSLNEKGKEEARKTGEGLKGIIFKKAFSSPLIRAKETTKIILEASGNLTTPLRLENRIKEINFGEYEGQVYKKPNGEIDNEDIKKFFKDPLQGDGATKGGETTYQVMERTQSFIKDKKNSFLYQFTRMRVSSFKRRENPTIMKCLFSLNKSYYPLRILR